MGALLSTRRTYVILAVPLSSTRLHGRCALRHQSKLQQDNMQSRGRSTLSSLRTARGDTKRPSTNQHSYKGIYGRTECSTCQSETGERAHVSQSHTQPASAARPGVPFKCSHAVMGCWRTCGCVRAPDMAVTGACSSACLFALTVPSLNVANTCRFLPASRQDGQDRKSKFDHCLVRARRGSATGIHTALHL